MNFCFSGNIAEFYDGFQWTGWQADVKKLGCDEAVSCYPLMWTREGKELKCNRKIVSIQKQWDMYHHSAIAEVKKRTSPKAKKNQQGVSRNDDKISQSQNLVYQKH